MGATEPYDGSTGGGDDGGAQGSDSGSDDLEDAGTTTATEEEEEEDDGSYDQDWVTQEAVQDWDPNACQCLCAAAHGEQCWGQPSFASGIIMRPQRRTASGRGLLRRSLPLQLRRLPGYRAPLPRDNRQLDVGQLDVGQLDVGQLDVGKPAGQRGRQPDRRRRRRGGARRGTHPAGALG